MQNGYLLVGEIQHRESGDLRTGKVLSGECDPDNAEQWYPVGTRILFDPADAKKCDGCYVLHVSEVLAVVSNGD